MSDFIETLRSVGGVKPCPCFTLEGSGDVITCTPVSHCPNCHGTGSIIDLAPLLAKPKELEKQAGTLVYQFVEDDKKTYYARTDGHVHYPYPHRFKNLHIVGLLRASNLVY